MTVDSYVQYLSTGWSQPGGGEGALAGRVNARALVQVWG